MTELRTFQTGSNDDLRRFKRGAIARVERLLGDRVVDVADVSGGYSPAARWRLRCEGGGYVFAKVATSPYTAAALRLEHRAYNAIRASFMPTLIGWEDHVDHPVLIIEDLSEARWPPPWTPALVESTQATLQSLHAMRCALPSFASAHALDNGWLAVADDPRPFLSLNLVSREWLDRALPQLILAGAQVNTAGDATIHFDVRSGNLCFSAHRGVLLIDWNWSCRGNAALDLGFWLPSLQSEGGPSPELLMPHRPDIAAWVSGFFAARAGLPTIADAPDVRRLQFTQLLTALQWVKRALGLPARLSAR